MITWTLVLERLQNHRMVSKDNLTDLEQELRWWYEVMHCSVHQIADLTEGECCYVSIRNKMIELGIPLRAKGGKHYSKDFTITKEEYKASTYKEMALKHKASMSTIRNRCKKFIKTNGKKKAT